MHVKVDDFIRDAGQWKHEFELLRSLVLECGLTEEFKWRQPCYSYGGKNVAIIGGFKTYCVLSFFKGSLLADPHKLLVAPGEHTQSGRQLKCTSVDGIKSIAPIIKAYILEAIEIEKAGLNVTFKSVDAYLMPDELLEKFGKDEKFKKAFEALTPGRQKGYLLYFSAAKQAATRAARIDAQTHKILTGKGFFDCHCGLSKKYPACDGSHKVLKTI